MFIKKFQRHFLGHWIEVYERSPHPKNTEGTFFVMVFRKRYGRKVLPIFNSLTASGVEFLISEVCKGFYFSPTSPCLSIAIISNLNRLRATSCFVSLV
jgi:hypothetical protein